jgi:hypothetical protein
MLAPRLFVCCVFAVSVIGCKEKPKPPVAAVSPAPVSPAPSPTPAPREQAQRKSTDVEIEMKTVRLHVDDGIVLDINRLRGVMLSRTPGKPPIFDDQRSYVLNISSADMSMDMASLSSLMNAHVFAYKNAPLTDLSVRAAADGRLEMKGKLRKGLTVPFSSKASVSATDDGSMRVHVESMKAVGVPVGGLMDLLSLTLDDLVSLKNRRGVDVRDNDIVIAPGQVLPPPEIRGRLARVVVDRDRLVLTYAAAGRKAPAPLTLPAPGARHYIYFGGGDITFGKLTMADADLQLIDADTRDAFDFYPAKYNAQLVAGYSKNTPQRGLKTFMPDFNDLQAGRSAGRAGGQRRR